MSKLNENIQKIADELGRSRDELRLEVKLGSAEIRDEWEELEKKWEHLGRQMKRAGHEAAESSEDVSAALSLLTEELKKSYRRIRKAL
jgi:archaellum component FlaC